VSEPVLLLHGYDSKPSVLGDLADRLGPRAELVAGFEDLPEESFAWWLGDLSIEARQDLTEYLDEISLEATQALRSAKAGAQPNEVGLAALLSAKTLSRPSGPTPDLSNGVLSHAVLPDAVLSNPSAPWVANGAANSTVSIVGFSQGAAAALSWLLHDPRQTTVSTLIAVAGFLPDLAEAQLRDLAAQAFECGTTGLVDSESALPSRKSTVHIHLVHLSDDEVVDAMVSERASRQLSKAGFKVTDHYIEGRHAWSPALTDLAALLLSKSSAA
jgi:Phospholipase/Carboxylesterase